MTKNEIIKLIKNYVTGEGGDEKLQTVLFKEEVQKGGEGEGDEYYHVFSVMLNNKKTYFKIQGWYNSWNGVDWDGSEAFEVTPVPKIIQDWEPVEC